MCRRELSARAVSGMCPRGSAGVGTWCADVAVGTEPSVAAGTEASDMLQLAKNR